MGGGSGRVLGHFVLEELPRRVHAFVLDQRGFGDSERPDGLYRIDDFAADAVAFLDALSTERATFVGHSFGSFVTRKATLTNPERVAKMVLIGAGEPKDNPVLKEVQTAMADLPDPVPIDSPASSRLGRRSHRFPTRSSIGSLPRA